MGRRNRNGNGKGVPAPGIGAPGQKHYFAVVDGKVCRVRIVRKQEAPDMWLVMLKNGELAEVAADALFSTRQAAIRGYAIRGVEKAIEKIMSLEEERSDASVL